MIRTNLPRLGFASALLTGGLLLSGCAATAEAPTAGAVPERPVSRSGMSPSPETCAREAALPVRRTIDLGCPR